MGDMREIQHEGRAVCKVKKLVDEAKAGIDPNKHYALDQRWVEDLELMFSEYMAGGFGDLEDTPELRTIFGELEGWYMETGGEAPVPEELMRRYVEYAFAQRRSIPVDADE